MSRGCYSFSVSVISNDTKLTIKHFFEQNVRKTSSLLLYESEGVRDDFSENHSLSFTPLYRLKATVDQQQTSL